MKNDKHSIVENEDMKNQEEFTTEKKPKKELKTVIFASALVLVGAVTSISLIKNHKIKDEVSISTSSTNSLVSSNDIENTSNINSESEQISVIFRNHSVKTIYDEQVINNNVVRVPVYVINITTDEETLISGLDKEAIAFGPLDLVYFETKEGYMVCKERCLPIYNYEEIPTTGRVYIKTNTITEDGLPLYDSDDISYIYIYNREYMDETKFANKKLTGFTGTKTIIGYNNEMNRPIYGDAVTVPVYETYNYYKKKNAIEIEQSGKTK